jgi:predicted DsbA family dithiol-disulfide isomerase
MTQALKIDFVSDVACPWCAIGLRGLEIALDRIGDAAEPHLTFHPFELNPDMPAGGRNRLDYITAKYGISPDEARANRERIKARAAKIGFTMSGSDASRTYNTFDAHRLLAWAEEKGGQLPLKRALLAAYFTEEADPSDPEVLVAAAERAGLDGMEAREVIVSERFAAQVRREEAFWSGRGITSVPAVVVNDRYLISGGQPPEAFEEALRGIMAGPAAA